MRILINDFGGYPFPLQLSKYLARTGQGKFYIPMYPTSKLHTATWENDAGLNHLTIVPVLLNAQFSKYSFLGRFRGEYDFARQVSQIIDDFKPDPIYFGKYAIAGSGFIVKKNANGQILNLFIGARIFIVLLWAGYLQKRLPLLAAPGKRYFRWKETRLLEQSDYVITITPDFNKIFAQWGIRQKKLAVIQNWGPIGDIPIRPKHNAWSEQHFLDKKLVVLYFRYPLD